MQTKPNFTIGGLKRPAWVNSKVRQRAFLVLDASGSMRGKKARDVETATSQLVAELAKPANKDAFDICVVRYDTDTDTIVPTKKATEAAADIASFELLKGRGRATNITAGLEEAERAVASTGPSPECKEVDPLLLLFTDGMHNTGESPPEPVADRLKASGVTIVSVAYGSDADEGLLLRLASSPQHFFRCRDGKDLRAFFAAIGATLSASVPRGINPKHNITTIRQ